MTDVAAPCPGLSSEGSLIPLRPLTPYRRRNEPKRPGGPRLALYGFGAVPGAPVSPAGVVADRLGRVGWSPFGLRIDARSVPLRWRGSFERIAAELDAAPAAGVLLVALNADAPGFRVERLARNRVSDTADIDGRRPDSLEIISGGAPVLAVRAPTAALIDAVRREDLPCEPSDEPGDHLANFVLYRLLAARPNLAVGLLHVPRASGLGAGGVFPLGLVQRGVQAAALAFAGSFAPVDSGLPFERDAAANPPP